MSIEAAVYHILTNTTGVTDIVAKRIYPVGLPQGKGVPAVVYQQISSENVISVDGPDGLRTDRIQIVAWDDDPDGARTLAEAVRAAMVAASGSHGSVIIRYCSLENEGDAINIHAETERLDRYGKRQDWQICYA